MSSILKVDQLQDSGGNAIITSNGSGTITVNGQPFKNGITMADQWRLSTTLGDPGDVDITANIERVDNATFAKIGTGMSESSGIFTFPSTGLYTVIATYVLLNDTDSAVNFYTSVSSNSGSSYDEVARAIISNRFTSSGFNMGTSFAYVNVTNASTFRVKFRLDSSTSTTSITGNTNYNVTHWTFIRLGDSQ